MIIDDIYILMLYILYFDIINYIIDILYYYDIIMKTL